MALSIYDVSIPVFIRQLNNMVIFMKKGQAWAEKNGHDHDTLLNARQVEDMQPLIFQVQRVSDAAKGFAVRAAGVDPVVMEDNEKTFEDLYERIEKTLAFLRKLDRASFEGKEHAETAMKIAGHEYKFTGLSLLQQVALPNFFFHETMTYALLRKMGVPVGKLDYLGPVGDAL